MSTCIAALSDVWVLTAMNTNSDDRYVVGVYVSEQLAEDSRDELSDQLENTRINRSMLFKRNAA